MLRGTVIIISMLWAPVVFAASIDLTFTVGTEATSPEAAVAGSLASLCPALLASDGVPPETQRLYDICAQLRDGADPTQAYRALSSRTNTSIGTLFVQQPPSVPFGLIGARLAALQRRSAASLQSSNEFFDFDALRIPSAWVLAAADSALVNDGNDAAPNPTLAASPWSFYLNGEGSNYTQDALASVAGFKGNTLGALFGLDYRWGSNMVVGAASRLAKGSMDIVADGGALDTSDANVTFYGSWFAASGAHVDITAGVGTGAFKMTRRIQFVLGSMTVDDTAKGSPNGNQYSVSLGAGYDPYLPGGINASFSGALRYSASTIDAYDESGSNGLNLHIDSQKLKSTSANLSALLQKAISFPSFVLLPQASLSYVRHLGGDDAILRARFIADPAQTPFEFKTKTEDPDFATLALGTSAIFPGGSTLFAQYERQLLTQHYAQQSIALGWRREF